MCVKSDGKFRIQLAIDETPGSYLEILSSTAILTVQEWTFLVFSVEMENGENVNVQFWKNNANPDGAQDLDGVF
jgi:hypothetical protein